MYVIILEGNLSELLQYYSDVIDSHREWLSNYVDQRANRWEALLSSDPEAAICEAYVRKIMSSHVESIELYEDPSSGGPDFLCKKNSTDCFYLETTCISISAATKITSLEHPLSHYQKAQGFRLLTKRLFSEMCNKTPQCSGLDAPCLLAIGTLHTQAGWLCMDDHAAEELLTGTTFITATIDSINGKMIRSPYNATDLRDSSFIRPNKTSKASIQDARRTISAVLLCSLGTMPTRIIGLIHPNPKIVFQRVLLPKIKFAKLNDNYHTGQFKVEWI